MIQPFAKEDLERIGYLQPDGWQDITGYFRFYLESAFCRPLKVEDGGRIVALGSVILHRETAWLAHIIVAENVRRRGLGLDMTRELIALAGRESRNRQLLIATSMGRPLYERLGFSLSCEYLAYSQHEPAGFSVSSLLRPLAAADLPDLLALDRIASGEVRSSLLEHHADSALVYRDETGLRGFYLPAMDEGLAIAGDAAAGLALMQSRMATCRTVATLPAGNVAANVYLQNQGLEVKRRLARMVRSGNDPLDQNMLFNRIGGHVG